MTKNTAAGLLVGLLGLASLSWGEMLAFGYVVACCVLTVVAGELRDLATDSRLAPREDALHLAGFSAAVLSWLAGAGAILSLMI